MAGAESGGEEGLKKVPEGLGRRQFGTWFSTWNRIEVSSIFSFVAKSLLQNTVTSSFF